MYDIFICPSVRLSGHVVAIRREEEVRVVVVVVAVVVIAADGGLQSFCWPGQTAAVCPIPVAESPKVAHRENVKSVIFSCVCVASG